MAIYDERLWKYLKDKAGAEDEGLPEDEKCADEYLTEMRRICDFAVERASTIRDVFPLYTLHDERHICGVMRKIADLLGESGMKRLSRDETAMLILAACCHDLGMSCSEDQQLDLQNDLVRLEAYYKEHPGAYVRMQEQEDKEHLPEDLLRDFLRSVHHERVAEVLGSISWPDVLGSTSWPDVLDRHNVPLEDLVKVCESHGMNAESIVKLAGETPDLRMCAILLRLADILDFDSRRAPRAVYEHCGFYSATGEAAKLSAEEWKKHMASHGVKFEDVKDRSYPYELPYSATCRELQTERVISTYLDWVDRELADSQRLIRHCTDKWRTLILPGKISRKINVRGYESGEFRFTLDQDRVLELLVGNELYQDPGVFVRELLQNAIDAVRTRQKMEKSRNWNPQIDIRSWMDAEGYHWFRIEDNGIGMNRDIIEKYFLKVGKSYYASDDFQRDKYRNEVEAGYQPISRFGIGILSCFMGDKTANRVEVSTLHYEPGSDPLRMSLPGLEGYYYLAKKSAGYKTIPMPNEKDAYRNKPGTTIAVRTNLYQRGSYRSFREILDQYVAFPEVPIHYEDENGSYDYPTEQLLMETMHAVAPSDDPEKQGVLEFSLTPAKIQELEERIPGLKIQESPRVVLKCVCLDRCTDTRFLSGVVLLTKVVNGTASCRWQFGGETVEPEVEFSLRREKDRLIMVLKLRFPEEFDRRMRLLETRERDPEYRRHKRVRQQSGRSAEETRNSVNSAGYLSFYEQRMLSAYRAYSRGYDAELCDLGAYPWYTNFCLKEKGTSIAAHNGVRCGNASFLLKPNEYSNPRDAILLLKDGYRPELDVSRAGVRSLPLETEVELAILRREWEQEGFDFYKEDLAEKEYWRIPGRVYHKLISDRPKLEDRLSIETDCGKIPVKKIPELLRSCPELELRDPPELFSHSTYRKDRKLYAHFTMACLRKNHMLVGSGDAVLLRPVSAGSSKDWEEFPPTFFLPVEGNTEKLAASIRGWRYFCNEEHPLARYLIQNRAWLEKYTPGLFREIMNSLAADNRTELIPKVNQCLNRIQAFPGNKPHVPEDAFLSEKDFW